jgi:hypothetical protein
MVHQEQRKVLMIWELILVDISCEIDELKNILFCLAQLIRLLHSSLSKKIENYTPRTDPTIKAIFLLNNVNYLLKRLDKYLITFKKISMGCIFDLVHLFLLLFNDVNRILNQNMKQIFEQV